MLPRHHRLRHSRDFTRVMRGRQGGARGAVGGATRTAGSALLVMHRRDYDETRPPRVGFVVSKAVGNSVVRHRVSRRLRSLAHQRIETLPAGADVVIRANPRAASATWPELQVALDRCWAKVDR